MQKKISTAIFYVLFVLSAGYAHIDKTSLSIKGGETFQAGEKVQITWKLAVFHNKTNYIYFSPASGEPWQKIDSVPEKSGQMNMAYTWTVPQAASTTARIRIFQSAVASPGEQSNDYTIVSNPFTITSGSTSVRSSVAAARLQPSSAGRFQGASFDLQGRRITFNSPKEGARRREGVAPQRILRF